MGNEIHEECGVFGIFSNKINDEVALQTYYGIFALQHRGQESCGIAVNDTKNINRYKDVGIVNDVFNQETLKNLGLGKIAVGHVRYGTKITATRSNSQPMTVSYHNGSMTISMNGSIINEKELKDEMKTEGYIFHSVSQSELIAALIARERIHVVSIEKAVLNAVRKLKGAYSLLVMSGENLIGARDPYGFRPLVIGKTENGYVLASETCALDAVGADFIRDVKTGEIVVIDDNGIHSLDIMENSHKCKNALCSFEYIYFSRPDSVVDGNCVHKARKKTGALLAMSDNVDADVVIGVPDSGIDAAIGYAEQSGIPYGLGFIKNKYIGRTFIENDQKNREQKVKIKLNVIKSTVNGKRVIMVDDSIVRGTTCAGIVKLLRNAGAREIHVRSAAPKFLYPCFFGTDVNSKKDLIACKYTTEEIAKILDADTVGFLATEDLPNMLDKVKFCMCDACFTGNYPVDVSKLQEN